MSKKLKGFAYMKLHDPERFHEICVRSGKRSWKLKKGHRWTRAEAQKWARKGAQASRNIIKVKL